MVSDYIVPDEVLKNWGKQCDCCPDCHQEKPCGGVMAGGLCDQMCGCLAVFHKVPTDDQQEINLKIAELLDLDYWVNPTGTVFTGSKEFGDKFDPINDPVQRDPLIINLGLAGWSYHYAKYDTTHRWNNGSTGSYSFNKHFSKATCLAFIEMMESKE